ncbi:MAG: NAD(P)/FAD-dependent oxidoreductase [Nanoarchaeota archaeon]|nr:NAD(P)/FAD-dependent oxidoreductase [Nanoarchaeota archaeon]MBU1703917.1 NAD(P)/FAD-dependent oxidoreductase [Nanoarchaeota archaeon]
MHDVIVVGAGLAGLSAVAELDKAGVDYVCFEKQKEYSINCGEGISLESLAKVKLGIKPLAVSDKIIIRLDKDHIIDKKIAHIDRLGLQKGMAKGKNIKYGCSVKIRNGYVEDSTGKVSGKVIIDASGVSKGKCYTSYGYEVAAKSSDDVLFEPLQDNFGLFWAFPKLSSTIIGVSYIGKGLNVKKELAKYYEKYYSGAKLLRQIAGRTPVTGPMNTVTDNMIYCGDAGGFVGAALGDGIYYALMSGRMAGKAAVSHVVDGKSLHKYDRMWKSELGWKLKKSLWVKRTAYFLYKARLIDLFEGRLLNYYKKKVFK